jgi:SmpA/OmlA family protein
MTMNLVRLLVPALAALIPACANYAGSIAPGTPAQDVQARVGPPADVWKNADGTETWEYRQGPAGYYTYMIDLGPDRAVRAVHQVLDEPYFAKVQPGMSREEVQRLLGAPKEVVHYPRRNEEVWTWRFKQEKVWYRLFMVSFDESSGAVVRTFRMDDPTYYDKGGKRG